MTDTGPGEPPERRAPDAPPPDTPPDAPPPDTPPPDAPPPSTPPAEGGQPSSAWAPPASAPAQQTTVPPPPGAPPPPGTGYGWNPPPAAGAPAYAPQRTNTNAVISLVLGIAQFVICPVIGGIGAIVTGHIAQGQIKRSNGTETGRGMARAGTILGYVGLALFVLAIAGAVVVFVAFGDDITRAQLRSDGREFVREAKDISTNSGEPVRDPETLRLAYVETDLDDDTSMRLADGKSIDDATMSDWEQNGWQVQVHGSVIDDADVCVQVPATVNESPVISNGLCRAVS